MDPVVSELARQYGEVEESMDDYNPTPSNTPSEHGGGGALSNSSSMEGGAAEAGEVRIDLDDAGDSTVTYPPRGGATAGGGGGGGGAPSGDDRRRSSALSAHGGAGVRFSDNKMGTRNSSTRSSENSTVARRTSLDVMIAAHHAKSNAPGVRRCKLTLA